MEVAQYQVSTYEGKLTLTVSRSHREKRHEQVLRQKTIKTTTRRSLASMWKTPEGRDAYRLGKYLHQQVLESGMLSLLLKHSSFKREARDFLIDLCRRFPAPSSIIITGARAKSVIWDFYGEPTIDNVIAQLSKDSCTIMYRDGTSVRVEKDGWGGFEVLIKTRKEKKEDVREQS